MLNTAKLSLVGSCALIALASLLSPAPASAADEHLLDPLLSLTGSTATSAEDEVPDPGPNHPLKGFSEPCGVATDPHGDIYVSSPAINNQAKGPEGRIDVFNPKGEFLTEIADGHGPCGLAVDSEGNLYVKRRETDDKNVVLYRPSSYPPTRSTSYSFVEVVYEFIPEGGLNICDEPLSVAVDPSDDHLYIGHLCRVEEYGSAADGLPLIDEDVTDGAVSGIGNIDVYGKDHDIYVTKQATIGHEADEPGKVLVIDGSDGSVKCEIDGSETPGGTFDFFLDQGAGIAVDQSTGDLYLYEGRGGVVDQFSVTDQGCAFIGELPAPPRLRPGGELDVGIAVDDPIEAGEAGYDSPNEGYVYVTSGETPSHSHLFAFRPKIISPPVIQGQVASATTETETTLRAELNPGGLDTHYRFEYTTRAEFEADGYAGARSVPVPDAGAGEGGSFTAVFESITGLEAGTAYRFRLVAANCEPGAPEEECVTEGEGKPGEEGEDASFSTYPAPPVSAPCPNEALRTGPSAALPDCRAYELVTPPDTNGRIPTMAMLGMSFGASGFDTTLASPDGESLLFGTDSGSLPGIGGGGFNDTFAAVRTPDGWQSQFTGLSGAQAEAPYPGGISADHLYSFWTVEGDRGSLANSAGGGAQYLRLPAATDAHSPNCGPPAEPEGRFEWVGCGALGAEPRARGAWISPDGGHVIFETRHNNGGTALRLEPCAPPTGTDAVYDRTPDGPTRCVSVPPAGASLATRTEFETQDASFLGAAADGAAVAFDVGGTLYLRVGEETLTVATGHPSFGGVSRDGSRVFYVEGGDIFAFDTATEHATQVGSGGESTLVNISADGSHVYFVSPERLDGSNGEEGKENLYVWDGSTPRFIAVLGALDVEGEFSTEAGAVVGGLGQWVSDAVWPQPGPTAGPANDPSRTTPDGKVLVFQSHLDLTSFHSGGHSEIYRYDAEAPSGEQLACVSCNPSGAAAESDAQLQSDPSGLVPFAPFPPVNAITHIAGLSGDGKMVFFQTADSLVPEDLDGKVNVYEWEAEGTGGCRRAAGCLSLISGGRGTEDDYLYAMTPDGHDIFFMSGDTLVSQDPDKTPSIYDARVNGGFPPAPSPPSECLGEACQPTVAAPNDASPATSSHLGPGNPRYPQKRPCPKSTRAARRSGGTHCGRRHGKHRHAHKRHGQPKHKRRRITHADRRPAR